MSQYITFKGETSIPISVRHIVHQVDSWHHIFLGDHIEQSPFRFTEQGKKLTQYYESFIESYKNTVKSRLNMLGKQDGVDIIVATAILNNENASYSDLLLQFWSNVKSINITDEELAKQLKLGIMRLMNTSFSELVTDSNDNRTERLNSLWESNSLNDWGSIFRQSEWTNKFVFSASKNYFIDLIRVFPHNEGAYTDACLDNMGTTLHEDIKQVVNRALTDNEAKEQFIKSCIPNVIKRTLKLNEPKVIDLFRDYPRDEL